MRNRLRLTWGAGVATFALAAAALFVGTPTTLAQMHTEVVGMPAGGAAGMPASGSIQVGGGYGESGLITVHEDNGRPGLSTGGGYAVPMGPICTVEAVGGGPGFNQVSNEACGIGGGYVESAGGERTTRHYP